MNPLISAAFVIAAGLAVGLAPSNGKIKFNEDLVHPTRTRHGLS